MRVEENDDAGDEHDPVSVTVDSLSRSVFLEVLLPD